MDYQPGDRVPQEIIERAKCDPGAKWIIGAPITIVRDGDKWIVRPQAGVKREDYDFIIYIKDSTGCQVDGKWLDVEWPGYFGGHQ